ncbi:sugar transferase [Daejeonella lutea]|uniref:Sugar transferase involved in LPS biosynthesis (Colanic, teichoic acid) n=1 Tax=Daejeonella lutea TaxID=572036 RepID=A0A1T5FAU3_9SPHI|nr:sugar transferase [Daejeonella lutea]SKB93264.1 Sugar transferase involved in LPS biosynthesis (colanic, teichoic acid) [Daejeonella lutea]
MYRRYFKRGVDLLVSITVIIVLLPIFVLVTGVLAIALRGNPFFIQPRPGLNSKVFRIIKFRTMRNTFDNHGKLLPDDERLFKLGKLIRRCSLDEIPQLINVVIGDMSLIGPRPLLVEYLHLYSADQNRRHLVRPGITGWAQVNGRNAITWTEKFDCDIWYVDHISLGLDFKIVLLTMMKVFKGADVNQSGHVTTEKFGGNA